MVDSKFESAFSCFNPFNVTNEVDTSSETRTLNFKPFSVTRISRRNTMFRDATSHVFYLNRSLPIYILSDSLLNDPHENQLVIRLRWYSRAVVCFIGCALLFRSLNWAETWRPPFCAFFRPPSEVRHESFGNTTYFLERLDWKLVVSNF